MTTAPLRVATGPERPRLGDAVGPFDDLLATDGKRYSLSSFHDREVLVVVFNSNRCPTANAYEERLIALQRDYGPRGVQVIAINSTDPHLYREESYDAMVERGREHNFNFPYLKDADQKAARAFGAECTLHAFVLDRERRLRYRGRIDDSRNPAKVTVHDLTNAIDDVLAARPVGVAETVAFGCRLDIA